MCHHHVWNTATGLGGLLTGGQRLFDDASLRLAKGRRLLDSMDADPEVIFVSFLGWHC